MRKKVSSSLERWVVLSGLLTVMFFWQGCQSAQSSGNYSELPGGVAVASASNNVAPVAPIATGGTSNGTDTNRSTSSESEVIRVGDSMTVVFSDTPVLVPAFEERVKEDGTITLLYNKRFEAAGKSRGELEKDIRARYVPDYYVNLTVTVHPKERSYTIGGEVKSPNRYAWYNGLTLLKAIQASGDFTEFAKKKAVQVTRSNGQKETVNCVKALRDAHYDIPIYPNDHIHVPRTVIF
jgi:protein involved in polysaccharide export with SLBB domain